MNSSAVAWVCPVVFDFPEIYEKIEFRRVVADLIDDQRQWPSKPEHLRRVDENYAKIIKLADLVTCNCEPVREGFRHLRTGIELVPNGAEIFRADRAWSDPEDLQELSRPLIGYVGNLRDRIDIDLLRKIATEHPDWSVVLVGSAHGAPEIIDMARELSNIHLLGVRPYSEALSYIRAFDVAIMPHLRNGISQNMNPLKLYVYYSLGVPVVSTNVENIEDIRSHIAVAQDHAAFIAAIEASLATGGKPSVRDAAAIGKIGWPFRLGEILGKLDAIVA